jgi:hypothetical protein
MSFSFRKNNVASAFIVLLLWSILLRVIVYALLPPARELEAYGTKGIFFSALTDHFGAYFSNVTYIPPVSYLLTASVFWVFGIQGALHIHAFILLAAVMNVSAVMFLFSAAKKTGASIKVSLVLLCLFSAVLVPFELWREGLHYDHHTIFFVSFFAWALVNLVHKKNSYAGMVWVSLAGALLVSQSAVNSAIVPFSVVLILATVYVPSRQFKKLVAALVIGLFLPAAALLMISKKNQKVGGEMLTSNKGGPAMMMVVQRAYNYDTARIRAAVKESGAPGWYIWAYDHAAFKNDTITGQPANLMYTLSQAFGDCFSTTGPLEKVGPYGFDFHPLLMRLREDSSLLKSTRLVESDSIDALHQPYRMSGYSPELTPRWIGVYGNISKKIFFKTLVKNPGGMIKAFIIQQGIFSVYGPLFPYNTMKKETNLLVRAGLRSLPSKIPLDPLFSVFVLIFACIGWITYAAALIVTVLSFIHWIRKRNATTAVSQKTYFLSLSIPVILTAGVFSCLVGGENDRYFMQLTPYIILLAICLPGLYRTMRPTGKNLN